MLYNSHIPYAMHVWIVLLSDIKYIICTDHVGEERMSSFFCLPSTWNESQAVLSQASCSQRREVYQFLEKEEWKLWTGVEICSTRKKKMQQGKKKKRKERAKEVRLQKNIIIPKSWNGKNPLVITGIGERKQKTTFLISSRNTQKRNLQTTMLSQHHQA